MNILLPIIINMLHCAVPTTSKVSDSSMVNGQLSHLECLLLGHIPVVVGIETPLGKGTATAATEHVTLDFVD